MLKAVLVSLVIAGMAMVFSTGVMAWDDCHVTGRVCENTGGTVIIADDPVIIPPPTP